ncbi:hypothetical protein Rs2_15047 [Raphanus sativus]|uniref:NDR1/HIN1-like protein 13 n=1 Tax=Raphanus sativus TaxID=3726 RepID=A0A6J0N988_RAPSA|nr:NDR1/HIN1-like protein 13 [Raphanus sativus]KAJ4901096.1 hypothetical protein Rs2_15047 [Raphanus sativus]
MSHHHHYETNPHFARLPSQNQHLKGGGASTSQTPPHQTSKSHPKAAPGIQIKPRDRHGKRPVHEPPHSVIPVPLRPEDQGKRPVHEPPHSVIPVPLRPEERLPPRETSNSSKIPVLSSPEEKRPARKKNPNSAKRPLLLSPDGHHQQQQQRSPSPPQAPRGYTTSLPPIAKPTPWRTAPTPSPHHRGSHRTPPPPSRDRPSRDQTNAATWSAAFCCAIFWIILILSGLVVLIVYLVYRPRSPHIDISSANLNAAYLDMGFLLNGDLTMLANFTNPNKKSSVEFTSLTFELYYYNTLIASQYIQPFKVPKKMSMFANVHLVTSQVQLEPTQSRELQRQIENGPVLLNVRGTFHARSNLGALFRYSYTLHTHCSFSLNSPPSGAMRARRCSTKR